MYCLYMIMMSYKNKSSPLETFFYITLILVQISLLLPDELPGVSLLRPFLRRPEIEVEEERFEIVRRYQVPRGTV